MRRARCYLEPVRWLSVLFLACVVVGAELPSAVGAQDWGLTRGPRGRAQPRGSGRGRAQSRGRGRGRARSAQPQPPAGERNEVLIQRYMRIVVGDPRETFAFRRLVELYRERDGDVEGLVTEMRDRVDADVDAYAPRMILGHILRAQNRIDEARTAYSRAAGLRPRQAAPSIALAHVERRAENLPEARRHFDAALQRTRERIAREELLREVAAVAMEQRDFDAARAYFEQLGRGGGSSVYLRGEYARALAAAREWDLATEEYERVIRSLRGDNRVLPPILLELARVQLETGVADESIETLDRALRTAGRHAGIRAEIYDQMRIAYRRTDRLPELAERLRREARGGYEGSSLLATIEDELGNDAAALTAYRRALRARPRDIDARRRIIRLLLRSGRLAEVVGEYRALIHRAPREPRFVIELAMHLMQTDQREEALRLVRDAGRRHPREVNLHDRLAHLYARWGETELANREVEILARIDPHDPAHVIALGSQQLSLGDRDQALATWRRVLEVDRDRAHGHATLAGVLADHDLLPQAIEEYRHAVRLEPDGISYVRGLATTLERHRDTDGAEREWRRVLDLADDDRVARREARERIVGIWARVRSLPAHIRELERAVSASVPDPVAGRFLAEAYRRHGPQFQVRAEQVLARIVEAEPGDVESLLALERIRRHRGDLPGAIDALGRLRDADPRRASRYLHQMAEHSLALYRDEDAVRYAAEAVERNPDDASAHRRLADLYRARQDLPHAIRSYRRALELNDRMHPVYFELAELYLAGGRTEEADRLYRRVLRITPDDDLVSRAARASIQINLGAGTLAQLERDLLPLALGHPERPIYRRMAVELYDAYAAPLARHARRGGEGAAEVRAELRQLGSRAIKPLLEALADQDPAQRRVALDILGDLGNPNAAAPLLALAESPTIDVRERVQALRAAGAVAQVSLTARFVALAEGSDPRMRGLATWGLARIGGRDAERALIRLRTSTDGAVRAYAAMGLATSRARGVAANLTRSLESDANEDVVFACTWALGRAGDESDIDTLVRVLRGRGGSAALVAADALGEIGGDRARDALIRALFEPDPRLRAAAAQALRRAQGDASQEPEPLPTPHAFENVREYVPRLVTRRGAAAPIDDLGLWGESIENAAHAALRGPSERVLAALALLDSEELGLGLGPLTADLDSWPPAQADRARSALDAIGAALVDDLVAVSRHEDAAVRVAAVRILVRRDRPEADAAVAAALGQPPLSVQRAALEALARTGRSPSVVLSARLADMLRTHRDWSMRTRAASALSGTSSSEARGALREALSRDPYAFVRAAAAESLGGSGAAADLAALERAREGDSEPRVREAAFQALAVRVR